MKKSFLIILILLGGAIGCTSEDDSPTQPNTTDTNDDTGNDGTGNDTGNDDPVIVDPDGDGIDSQVEIDQGTDPEDGCSFIVDSIDFSITTEEWRDLDCDEDGVTNRQELDPDGNLEIGSNTTDPLDSCSLFVEFQEDPPAPWLELNCDDDCYNNELELVLGTDPLTANNTEINQGILSSIRQDYGWYYVIVSFSQSPQRLNKLNVSSFGSISRDYEYDANQNLTNILYTETDQGVLGEAYIYYDGNQISSFQPFGPAETVEYDGNFIRSFNGDSPPGLYNTQIEIDPVSQKVLQCTKYEKESSTIYKHYTYTYVYDSQMENLLELQVVIDEYDSLTGIDTFLQSYVNEYEYYESVLNPASEAYSYHYIPTLLVDKTDSYFKIAHSYFDFSGQAPMTSKNLLSSFDTSNFDYSIVTDECAENNGQPLVAGFYPYSNQYVNRFSYQ